MKRITIVRRRGIPGFAAPIIACASLLAGCGGGGGSSAPPVQAPAPTVSLDASPASLASGQTSMLTWTSTNATSCTASGGWSGAKGTSGSEATAAIAADTTFTLTCTGTGGGQAADSATVTVVAPPTVTLTANPATTIVNHSTTLTWSSTNATSCTAADGWTGSKAVSGAESIGPLAANSTFTLTCTGPGGSSAQSATVSVSGPPAGNVVINGRITFDRFVFRAAPASGLDTEAPVEMPARHVVVELLSGGTTGVLASTESDLDGRYAFVVPVNTDVRVQARAQMLRAGTPGWHFRVRNNTGTEDPLYTMVSPAVFNSGTANQPHDLKAPTGWDGASYSGERVAAPFAILDTVFRAKELIVAANPGAVFPELNLFWSPDNRPAERFCPDDGNIITSSYVRLPPAPNNRDQCNQEQLDGIYILGDFSQGDTDEFDQHVLAHEFGHYFEDRFSRSDSVGGAHQGGDRLDLRVAFGEGWGNAFSGMALNDPAYRDSFRGLSDEFGFNLESDSATAQGWFSEFSVGEILWDVFDDATEPGDPVALGFTPIHAVMTGPQITTDALTSIFPFADALRSQNPAAAPGIGTLLDGESISGNDDFGSGESNNGGDPTVLPVYQDIGLNAPLTDICSTSTAGSGDQNKLGNSKFLRFVNDTSRLVTIQATGNTTSTTSVAATDPDILVHRRGEIVLVGEAVGGSETIPQQILPAGTYIIEVYDFALTGTSPPRCMTVSITG